MVAEFGDKLLNFTNFTKTATIAELSPFSATVAEFGYKLSPFSATIVASVDRA